MKKKTLWVAVAVCGIVVMTLNSPSRVNVVTGATPSMPSGVVPTDPSDGPGPEMKMYFYKVTHINGTISIEEMTEPDVLMFDSQMKTEYYEARSSWTEQKKKWARIMRGRKFPLPPAREPKCERIARVPGNEDNRDKLFAKIQDRLSVWDVCLLSDAYGQREVAIIRHDELYARWQSMVQQYCDGAITAKLHTMGSNNTDDGEPVLQVTKPAIKLIKSKFPSWEEAEEFAETVRKKLDEQEADKENEQAPPTQDTEPDSDETPDEDVGATPDDA